MKQEFTVTIDENGQRLDIFLTSKLPAFSRSAIQKAIKTGQVKVNQEIIEKPRHIVKTEDTVEVSMKQEVPQATEIVIPKIPIVYEDNHVVVINKPAGITVHPGQGQTSNTVSDWFANRYPDVKAGEEGRYGIVHRLDKETSGVMILAKSPESFEHLKDQFKRRRAKKEYLALVFGVPGETKGRITRPMSRSKRNPLRRTIDPLGKPAITEWRLEKKFTNYALIRAYPLTGRTHQIRVHLHFLGFPIVGDSLYIFKRQKPPQGVHRQLLHAEKLSLTLPNGKEKLFTAPLPDDFVSVLESLS